MFESRGVALGVVASVLMLVFGYILGQATAFPTPAAPAPREERLSAADAKARSEEEAFKDAQIAGLTARLGPAAVSWEGRKAPHERPSAFYDELRDARATCGFHANVVGVDCSEPPCIGLLRQVEGDVAAQVAACPSLLEVLPAPRVDAGKVVCASGREEQVVLVSPGAGERTPEVAAAEDARLAERQTAIRAGWRCAPSMTDVAH